MELQLFSNTVINKGDTENDAQAPSNSKNNTQNNQDAQNNTHSEVGSPSDAPASSAQATPQGDFRFLMVSIVIMMVMFYFFMYRPQKKREKEAKEMQSSIKTGDNIMTTSGYFGKVINVYDDVVVVEFGTDKSIKIPVAKSEVINNKEPNLKISTKED